VTHEASFDRAHFMVKNITLVDYKDSSDSLGTLYATRALVRFH
jgi:hypothetical protein